MSYDVLRKLVPNFGDKFRKAREAKKLSLDDVSRVTKISARMLQAIEDEHFDQLPGGVFNRGFIRAYAKHLGLNDEEAVNDYLACLRQAQVDANQFREPAPVPIRTPTIVKNASPAKPAPPKAAPKAPAAVQEEEELSDLQLPRAEHVRRPARSYRAQRDSLFPWMPVLLAVIVVLLITLFWTRHSRSSRAQVSATPNTAVHPSSQPAPTATPPSASAAITTPSTVAAASSPAPTVAKPALSSSTAQNKPAENKPLVNKPEPAAPTAKSDAKQPTPTNAQTSDATVRTPAKVASNAKAAVPMTLVIRASENCSISVVADGQLVSQETLIAPANTTVHATRQITVRVGNAAGVSFLWNKQDIPAQGAESEAKTLVFDQSGMRVVSAEPGQNP